MGQSQSKDELLCQLVTTGNVDAVSAFCREGANLECIDKDGKTPLIVACMDSGLFNVAKALIEMGANVNAYRPGRCAGTPLHHAAKRGLDRTVSLLLSCGANALVRNDDCQAALDVARIKGHTNVVRAIENHTCYFSGWLQEYYGPEFLEALASQYLSRKIWAVVIPRSFQRLELVIYPTLQEAQPRTVIALWKAKIEELKLHQSNPGLTIVDQSTKTRYKFASGTGGDKKQIYWLDKACRGIRLGVPPQIHHDTQAEVPVNANLTSAEAAELAMALNTSSQSAGEDRPTLLNTHQSSEAVNANGWEVSTGGDSLNGWGPANGSTHTGASSSGWMDEAAKEDYNGWVVANSGPVGGRSHGENHDRTPSPDQTGGAIDTLILPARSAPPVPDQALDKGPIHNPSTLLNTHQSSEAVNANGWEVSTGGDSLNGWGPANGSTHTGASSSGWMDEAAKEDYNGWVVANSGPVGGRSHGENHDRTPSPDQTGGAIDTLILPAPSAPPVPDQALDKGPIHNPSIDSGPVDLSVPAIEHGSSVTSETKDGGGSSSCIICWEAPAEGACIPCGHMAGCMACLSDIKSKKGFCPVCRAKIKQVLRLYAV